MNLVRNYKKNLLFLKNSVISIDWCEISNGVKAFTLIEVLITIFLIFILASFIVSIGLNFYKSQQLETHTQGILQTLRRAQSKAMSVELDSSFGVYLTDDSYTLFKGSSYVPDDPFNEVFDLPEILNLSGLSEVVFSKFEGKPNVTGNIILDSNGENRTININKFGTISLVPAAPPPPQVAQLHYRWRNDDGGQ